MDKLFGTFAEERAEVVYGIVTLQTLGTHFMQTFAIIKSYGLRLKMATHPVDKIKVWFAKPEWRT